MVFRSGKESASNVGRQAAEGSEVAPLWLVWGLAATEVWRRVLPKSWDMRMGSLWGREGGRGKEEGLEQWSNGAQAHGGAFGCFGAVVSGVWLFFRGGRGSEGFQIGDGRGRLVVLG